MKVAIIHYHLNRGGVTNVIVNQLRAINSQLPAGRRLPIALLYGGRREGWQDIPAGDLKRLDISTHVVDELDYDNVRPRQGDLAAHLQSTLQRAGFLPRETILHVHNHALGKNVVLPGAVTEMARKGYSALLQIHDFAEDFRPANYRALAVAAGEQDFDALPGLLYPQASQIHFAVLNRRDQSILHEAGVADSQLHLLPNSIADIGPLPSRDEARGKLAKHFGIPVDHRFVLYPVRGIRRKNLGEALLWSALADRRTSFGLTLPPMNPIEQPSYARWKELATRAGLPWVFEAGVTGGLAFLENLAAADLILTTSVAEGFGLAFLETWLTGRAVIGRDLPEITADFVDAGIRFPGLQPRLSVPVEWLPEDTFRNDMAAAYRAVLASYHRPMPSADSLANEIGALIQDGMVDFAACGGITQRLVIERVVGNPSDRERLRQINSWIGDALAMRSTDPSIIDRNAEHVRTKYSLDSCGRQLLAIYQQVSSSDRDDMPQPLVAGHRILDRFLDVSRFHPLRIES